MRLTGDEASDYLNFVVKDESTGEWYDLNGTNFQVGSEAVILGVVLLTGGHHATPAGQPCLRSAVVGASTVQFWWLNMNHKQEF